MCKPLSWPQLSLVVQVGGTGEERLELRKSSQKMVVRTEVKTDDHRAPAQLRKVMIMEGIYPR